MKNRKPNENVQKILDSFVLQIGSDLKTKV